MSAKTRLGNAAVNAQARATAELLNDGFFDLMDGDVPESDEQAEKASVERRLVRCSFGPVAFGSPLEGVLNANPIVKAVATRTGDPSWCRAVTKNDELVMMGTVGASNANAISPVETIVKGQIVKVDAFKHIISKQNR